MFSIIHNVFKGNILYFIIGLLSAFCVRLLGIITIGELLIILYVIFRFLKTKFAIKNYDKLLKWWLISFLSALAFSGINAVSMNFYFKGVVTILLLYFSFQFFAALFSTGNRYSIVAFIAGYCISNVLVNFYFLSYSDLVIGERTLSVEEFQEEMFAYIYFPITYLLNALLFERHKGKLILLNLAISIFFLFGGSRNSFVVLILSDVFILFNYIYSDKVSVVSNKIILKLLLFIAICTVLSSEGYSYLASNGYLGEGAQHKYEIQSASKGGIASSRSYFIRGLITIAHHPLGAIGFQQIPDDNIEIRQQYAKVSNTDMRYDDPNCAAHSSMLDWWIYFGILTFPFWIFIIKQCIRACKVALLSKNMYTALALVCSFKIIWNALFSPFGDRIMWGFQIVVVLYYLYETNNRQYGKTTI